MATKTLIFVSSLSIALSSFLYGEDDEKKIIREKIIPCTVKVDNWGGGYGSGVVIRSEKIRDSSKFETYVVSADHVTSTDSIIISGMMMLRINTTSVKTYEFSDRKIMNTKSYNGNVLWSDPIKDFAIIKIITDKKLECAELIDENNVSIADDCIVAGFPSSKEMHITTGMLQSFDETYAGKNVWRISAPIYYGNSGGGCWTKEGKLIGLVNMINLYRDTVPTPHIGYILPVLDLKNWIKEIKKDFLLENQ